MNRKQIALWIFIGVFRAFSFSKDAVVKISSYPCYNDTKSFAGSGMLFRQGKEVYVITSEHVVLHSNQNICHKVINANLGEREAELVRADWGMGLALLRLKGAVSIPIPFDDFLTAKLVEANEPVTAFGFAYTSKVLSQNNSATVLMERSQRGLIPLVPEMLEVVGGYVEYGMSGGPVVSNDLQKFIGILSHQALKLVPAQPSQVVDIDSAVPQANDFFVIPSYRVKAWVRTVLINEPNSLPSLVRDAQLQLQGERDIIFTDGLGFELIGRNGEGPIGGPEGAGRRHDGPVGGPEGAGRRRDTPVGGPEGAGRVGGNQDNSASKDLFQQVVVFLDDQNHAARWEGGVNQSWLDRVKSTLHRNETVRVPYFVKYDSNRSAAKRVFFHSLAEFFTLLENPQLQPVTVRETQRLTNQSSTEVLFESLDKKTAIYLSYLERLKQQMTVKKPLDATRVVEQLSLLGELLKARDYESIEIRWVKTLRTASFEAGWQQLFVIDFDGTVDQISILIQVIDLLEKINLLK